MSKKWYTSVPFFTRGVAKTVIHNSKIAAFRCHLNLIFNLRSDLQKLITFFSINHIWLYIIVLLVLHNNSVNYHNTQVRLRSTNSSQSKL